MDNDDILLGRLLSRRTALLALGAVGLGLVAGCTSDPADSDDEGGNPWQPVSCGPS